MSKRNYFNVEVRRTRYEYAAVRVPVDMTEDMTVQGAKNIAAMKACDVVREDIVISDAWPDGWKEGDDVADSLVVTQTELSNPAPAPSVVIHHVIEDLLDQVCPHWQAGDSWYAMSAGVRKLIESTMAWLRDEKELNTWPDATYTRWHLLCQRLANMKAPTEWNQ